MVSFGRLALLGSLSVAGPVDKVSVLSVKKVLQCPKFYPDLNGETGVLDLIKLVPTTRDIIEGDL